jgi:outer membrane protein TolC
MKKNSLILTLILAISLGILTPSKAQAPLQEHKLSQVAMAKQYAKQQLHFRGYLRDNWTCLESLWTKESHWNHKADNKQSTAYGIAQRLGEKSTNYVTQIDNGLRYIEHRYGNPCNAWAFWKKKNWY